MSRLLKISNQIQSGGMKHNNNNNKTKYWNINSILGVGQPHPTANKRSDAYDDDDDDDDDCISFVMQQ